ncbi:Vacuolar ATPase assembly integral membrane protein VMA21 [Apiospora phragmitis]|uniref:Vacuolar ATPase assembly integral membrane protein VMA21 n=1 Tax=Apiospora phragmitis TaxID=2905665 RepID=A0ABR1TUB2_9PEZI
MATRRIISSEKTILDQDDHDGSGPAADQKSNISPAVPMDVIVKLLAFTLAMIVVPIGSYFATVNTLFKGNSTFAGALAAVMANVVLIAYVVVAYNEDQSDQLDTKKRKARRTYEPVLFRINVLDILCWGLCRGPGLWDERGIETNFSKRQ